MRIALLLLLAGGLPAGAAEAPRTPVGIAISGAVSLGSWEAGFMYLWLEAQKAHPQSELRIVTGASAGSANAFISAISSCLPSNPHPLEDPGWQVWGPIGFTQLFDRARATDEALFVTQPIEEAIERVRLIWNRGLPESCDVVVGVSVTRVTPRQVKVQEGLTVPRSLETFLVRVQGRGMGVAPRLSNYVDPLGLLPAPLLPFLEGTGPEATENNFSHLRSLVLASGAFPLAFRAQTIEYCLSTPAKGGLPGDVRCVAPEFSELFVDGGVFDNNPLRLAWTTADHRLLRGADGRFTWAESQPAQAATQQPAVQYLSLDPQSLAFPAEPEVPPDSLETGFLSRVLSMSGSMVESAQARELGQLVNERGDLTGRLQLPRSNLPKASEHLYAFIGFFERDFRLFDFYLGMYDALVGLKAERAWSEVGVDLDALIANGEETRRGWAPFLCLASMTEPGFQRYRGQCEGAELENFRILLQVGLDLLEERCRPKPKQPQLQTIPPYSRCAQANTSARAAQVPGVKALPPAERRAFPGESSGNHFMRLLGAYGFEFTDLGLTRAQAHEGRLAMRRQLDEVADEWAGAQGSFVTRFAAKSAARLGLYQIEFSPPLFASYVSVGTGVMGGFSIVPFFWKPRWLQVTAEVSLGLLETLITEVRPRMTLAVSAGPEFHLTGISTPLLQPRLALRGGVQFGVSDGFGTSACVATDPRDCTQAMVELVGIITLIERLRLHLTWQTFPRLYGQTGFFRLQVGVGFQFL